MITKTVLKVSAATALCLPMPAMAAQFTDEQVAAMLERLNQLEQEVTSLRGQLSAVASNQQTQTEQIAVIEKATEESKAAKKKSREIEWKGAPKIKGKGGWSFKPRGRLQYDVGSVNAPDAIVDQGLGFSNEVRRARLGVEGDIPGGFGYKFELDFADDDISITDAILSYKDGGTKISVGQHNNLQSLEELTSSRFLSFTERAAFTDAFGFERRVGASVTHKTDDLIISGGLFMSSISDLDDDENNAFSIDGRIVYAPKIGNAQAHFGASIHWRELNDTAGNMRYRQRPFIHSTDTRFINTGNFVVDQELSYGAEAAIISGPFHAVGEVHWLEASRPGMANPTFFGGYAEVGYFLTEGDKRGYKSGKFDRIKPAKEVGQGGSGAIQVNLRYDYLDLIDAGIVGGTQNAYAASLIWTPIDYVRFMLNYAHVEYDNAAIAAGANVNYSVDVFGARAQIDF